MMVNTQEHMDLCAEYCHQMGLSPYYLTVRKEWREIWKTLDMPSRARQGCITC